VRTAVRGMYGERLKVAVSAPPEDDRANRELVSTVADWLGLPRDNVTIASGHASQRQDPGVQRHRRGGVAE